MTTASFASLGLDIAKAKFAAVLLRNGRTRPRHFANTAAGFAQLQHGPRAHAPLPLHACLEAAGCYGEPLALFLYPQGVHVSVVNPASINAYAHSAQQRNKTDKAAAAHHARFSAAPPPPRGTPPPPARRQRRARERRWQALQAMRQQERHRLDWEAAGSLVGAGLCEHIAYWERQMALPERQRQGHARAQPNQSQQTDEQPRDLDNGAPPAPERRAGERPSGQEGRAGWAANAAGTSPRQRARDRREQGKTRKSREGKASARRAKNEAAAEALRAEPNRRESAARRLAAGKPKMAVIGAVMRKLLHQAHGVLKHNRPFDPNDAPAT